MQHLPDADEQNWLVRRLAELIESRGREQFVGMPIVEPTTEFFPDPWAFSHEGLDRLVRRLMQYAGLGSLDVKIGTFAETPPWARRRQERVGPGIAGIFMGIHQGCCLFAFNEESPADSEYMAGVMCHEVAHAFRSHWELSGATSKEEEWLTDVTASYLGFGILAANNSYRCRTEAWNVGVMAYHSQSTHRTGYLPPQAFAFLLGAQMVMQDLGDYERARLTKYLEPNQAAFTKAAVNSMLKQRVDITRLLELCPDPGSEPIKGLDQILLPLPEYVAPVLAADPDSTVETWRLNPDWPVFRVRRTRASQYTAIGFLVGLAVGALGAVLLDQFMFMAASVVAGPAIGAIYGSRLRFDVCSEPDCEAVIEPGLADCPNCGGHIAGRIKNADDRLEAREEYDKRMRQESKRGHGRREPAGP